MPAVPAESIRSTAGVNYSKERDMLQDERIGTFHPEPSIMTPVVAVDPLECRVQQSLMRKISRIFILSRQ